MIWFKRLRLRSKRTSFTNNLEYLGEDFIQRVTKAARKETWGRTVIQLAWTAGPVTYLALQGGYLLGYGQSAPSNLFIYFAIYTIIAGVFAILMRFLYQITRGQELEKAEASLSQALVRLPDLIFFARNQTLLYYDEENRTLLAAKYLLENPDAVTETVRAAVQDVTGDSVLAQAAQRIEIFRKNGLYARIEDERAHIADRLAKAIEQVTPASSTVAELLQQRFTGRPPSKQSGRTRTEGFIGRVLAAGEEHDFDAMTLNDAEEIFTVAYELLAGRNIPVFSLHYIGSKEFTEASENFDRARLSFRKAAYLRNSRLRTLAELFAESEPVDIVPAAAPVFTTVERMYANILRALDQLYKDLKKQTSHMPFQRRKRHSSQELRSKFEQLHTAIELHRSLRVANNQLHKRYAALVRSEKKYNEVKANSAKQFPLQLVKRREHKRGIKIVEKHIELSKSSKLRCARQVQKRINTLDHTPQPQAEAYKQLAIDIAMTLERDLKISRFETQYAIESSNAPYLSSIELDMTAATKAGIAVALVHEVQKNISTPIQRLAHILVNYHGMPLNQESIDYLVENYGADPNRLVQLLPDQESIGTGSEHDTDKSTEMISDAAIQPSVPSRPPHLLEINRLDKKYQELIDYAVRMHIL
ncbi:MAG: hypothetical protein K9L66_03450 [Spirochaetaceae bacterium]|nr:hypothetical protein [Spirochaetaceae bacterium]MCF7948648.1 hypothetical protein [Spirochaetia bacterium]MCF7950708.1 hypothetical protein [Spirochaetaceae bacterium]